MKRSQLLIILLILTLSVLLWSGISPHNTFIWFLEVLPVMIAMPVLALTYKKLHIPNYLYIIITIHAVILMIGGHYTYEQVPLFNWLKDTLDLSRNYFDKVGHFFQGFTPALIIIEILKQKCTIGGRSLFYLIVTFCCLGISALYEIFEWAVAMAVGSTADAFLGMQGDAWDTQTDMVLALIGALLAQCLLQIPYFKGSR